MRLSKNGMFPMRIFPICLAALLVSCCNTIAKSQDMQFKRSAPSVCRLMVDASGITDAHRRFAKWRPSSDYLVCPFLESSKSSRITVYAMNVANHCEIDDISGMKIVESSEVPVRQGVEAASVCNSAISYTHKNLGGGKIKSYTWVLPMREGDGSSSPGDATYEESAVRFLMRKSGLPILFEDRSEGVICFEVPANEKDPISLFRAVGYQPPRALQQKKHAGKGCPEVVEREFGMKLPSTPP
jgi:hypothetical protein